ncbi:hypothetical protein AK812_SmicGene45730, partial [Symbiodinium microadriaticum]
VSVFFTIKDPSQADKFEPLLAAELRKEATRAATESGAHFRALTSSAFASILRLYGDGKNAAKHGKEAEILAYDLSTTISETFLAYALLRAQNYM